MISGEWYLKDDYNITVCIFMGAPCSLYVLELGQSIPKLLVF